ncbi:hypothetical protein WM40_00590 [Robbsia andropogonis]|uniref:Nitrate reductase associated protein n=1 Tax=Robbsia andropogonis TaxID=28092 RepID=A0A0F5K5H9_9BURK|nr:nitrate reductase associated protein [Robbsia andropogonis]KKB65190.1 hypothetical protein WM40_00590 [Robbsia andropogonis]MCP1117066.1 nitrate reductase associated protein [Robbsia andropogonis]MCP1128413.1 nitrate reductase associated protein [Robbsia andropogonis]
MNSHRHSDHLAGAPQLFAFEQPSCEDFTYIPLSVRFHLDRCGWRLSLAQWQAFPHADRVTLATFPVLADAPADVAAALAHEGAAPDASSAAFDTALVALAARHLREPIERTPPMRPMPGDDVTAVPEAVLAQCGLASVPELTLQQWGALSRFQRYALEKLSRKPKSNHDFLPALREFGLA